MLSFVPAWPNALKWNNNSNSIVLSRKKIQPFSVPKCCFFFKKKDVPVKGTQNYRSSSFQLPIPFSSTVLSLLKFHITWVSQKGGWPTCLATSCTLTDCHLALCCISDMLQLWANHPSSYVSHLPIETNETSVLRYSSSFILTISGDLHHWARPGCPWCHPQNKNISVSN